MDQKTKIQCKTQMNFYIIFSSEATNLVGFRIKVTCSRVDSHQPSSKIGIYEQDVVIINSLSEMFHHIHVPEPDFSPQGQVFLYFCIQ